MATKVLHQPHKSNPNALANGPIQVTPHVPPQPARPAPKPDSLEARYNEVSQRIGAAAAKSKRSASDIILVAVTKNAEPEQIKALLQLGHRDFGENRVQQLIHHAAIVEEHLSRQRMLPGGRRFSSEAAAETLFARPGANLRAEPALPGGKDGVRWHMIGHLQRNKARKVVEFVRLTHSVDSLRLAEELQGIALRKDHVIEVLIQVNCAGEGTKFGCPMPAAIPMAEQLHSMINVRLRGLMTIAPYSENPEDSRPVFARCRELFEEMSTLGFTQEHPFNILSMGMSGDFEVAISEGANIVRVGSAIFGEAKPGMEETEEVEEPE